jgi:hypothetical protein
MKRKIYLLCCLLFMIQRYGYSQLKSIVYDFDGLDINQSDLPEGDYAVNDLSYHIAANPLAASDMIGDRVLKINLNWNTGYGAFGRGISRYIEFDPDTDNFNFFFYNPVSNNQAATFDVVITDDDNQNLTYEYSSDDTWKKSVVVPGSSGWQFISIPLNTFTDINSGGNGIFDLAFTANRGMLLMTEFRFTKNSPELSNPTFYLDMINFSQGSLPHGATVFDLPPKSSGDYCLLGDFHNEARGQEYLSPGAVESYFPSVPGKKLKYVNFFLQWGMDGNAVAQQLPGSEVQTLLNNGYVPIITWEPLFQGYSRLDPVQPRLNNIINGDYDAYITNFANKMKTYSDTVVIRFMHEFEGDWYPWSITHNGQDPARYVAAYRHVVDKFRAAGATKVKWMWCVNSDYYPYRSYNWVVPAYPGDSYVNIIATDIYNNHYPPALPWWRSFRWQTTESYYYLSKYFPNKPLFICEVGCRERFGSENTSSESKGEWFARMDKELQSNYRKVRALLFFDAAPDQNWFLNSSSGSIQSLTDNIWYDDYYFNTTPPPTSACSGTGSISRELWYGISGYAVSSIPVNSTPSATGTLSSFQAPENIADNYGQRIRGYICPPVTGNYIFWIASDDNSELWLSTNDQEINRQKIAYVSGWTFPREWTKYSTQQSVAKYLVAGQKYYIEALHKEGAQGDNLAVGWQLPTGAQERPVPGSRLIPFNASPSSTVDLISAGGSWKYLDNGTNQGTAWRSAGFNDTSWKTGNAELGYGDGGEATVVSYGFSSSNKFITTYFRKRIYISDITGITSLQLSLIRDDGAVVYLNGTEIYRSNMPAGTIAYNTLAPGNINGSSESAYNTATVSSSALIAGNNVIAVEIHQQSANSSDISFNFKLKAIKTRSEDIVDSTGRRLPETPCTAIVNAIGATTFCYGGNVLLRAVSVQGASYQWIRNQSDISGAVDSVYTASQDGDYQVKISSAGCTAWSAPTTVTVNTSLTARINAEGSTTICSGGNVKLYANTCDGYAYQWKKDGEDIPDATQDTYAAVSPGSYQVMIIDGSSVAWSALIQVISGECDSKDSVVIGMEEALASTIKNTTSREAGNLFRVSVYPNPTTGLFTFDFCLEDNSVEELELRVLNAVGQTVYRTPPTKFSGCVKDTIELDSNLSTGVYFLQVRVGNRTENVKLMLER